MPHLVDAAYTVDVSRSVCNNVGVFVMRVISNELWKINWLAKFHEIIFYFLCAVLG